MPLTVDNARRGDPGGGPRGDGASSSTAAAAHRSVPLTVNNARRGDPGGGPRGGPRGGA